MGAWGKFLLIIALLAWLVGGLFTGKWQLLTSGAAKLALIGIGLIGAQWLISVVREEVSGGPYAFWRFVFYVSIPVSAWVWADASFAVAWKVFCGNERCRVDLHGCQLAQRANQAIGSSKGIICRRGITRPRRQ